MIKRQPCRRLLDTSIDRRGMQVNYLIVGDVPPPFPVTLKEFWIETPCYNRGQDHIVIVVDIECLGKFHKTPRSRVGPEGRLIKLVFMIASNDSPVI